MTTELQRQINTLRNASIIAKPINHGRPSLFLDPKEANGVDISAVLDSALFGLSTLQQYDKRFADYSVELFHLSSLSFQRELKTAEVSY